MFSAQVFPNVFSKIMILLKICKNVCVSLRGMCIHMFFCMCVCFCVSVNLFVCIVTVCKCASWWGKVPVGNICQEREKAQLM